MGVSFCRFKIVCVFAVLLPVRFIILPSDLILKTTLLATSVNHVSDKDTNDYHSSNAASNDASHVTCARTCTRSRRIKREAIRPLIGVEVVDNC